MGTDGKAVAIRQTTDVATRYGFTRERVELIRRTIADKATDDELEMFLYRCQKTGLDPIARQIHFVKRGDRGVIQTGIDGFRLIAERTGNYAGSDDPAYEEMPDADPTAKDAHPFKATVTVWKMVQSQRCPFTATARWSEYKPEGSQAFMWTRMPYLMLGKCAEALALRKAFPQDLSGLYINEEMHQATVEADAQPAPVQDVPTPEATPNPTPDRPSQALLTRWSQLWQDARELGVQTDDLAIPNDAPRSLVVERGKELASRIAAAKTTGKEQAF